ncbi:MAG: hypothetical protein WAW37_13920 [Syntrophobacteraceae bacterium]
MKLKNALDFPGLISSGEIFPRIVTKPFSTICPASYYEGEFRPGQTEMGWNRPMPVGMIDSLI